MRKVYCPALLKHADISQEVKAPCFFPRDMITAESRRNSHAVYTATGRAHFFLMGLGNMHDIYFFLDFSSFFLLSSLLSPLSSPIPGSLFSRFTLSLLHFLFLSFSFTFSTFFSSLFPSLTRAHLQSAHPSNFPSFFPPSFFPSASLFPRNGMAKTNTERGFGWQCHDSHRERLAPSLRQATNPVISIFTARWHQPPITLNAALATLFTFKSPSCLRPT